MDPLAGSKGIVVVGASAGGLVAFGRLLHGLGPQYPSPIVFVQHQASDGDAGLIVEALSARTGLEVREARPWDALAPGTVFVAPANYHLVFELEGGLALSAEERVRFSRPSLDVTFEAAAQVFGGVAMGVILSGANEDGSRGLRSLRATGAWTAVQDPRTAEADTMPRVAIERAGAEFVGTPEEIAAALVARTDELA